VLYAGQCVILGGMFAHILAMGCTFAVWNDSFSDNSDWYFALPFIFVIRFTLTSVSSVEFRALQRPAFRFVLARFIFAIYSIIAMIIFCTAVTYYGLVKPGNKTPAFVVCTIWVLATCVLWTALTSILRGIYYGLSRPKLLLDGGFDNGTHLE
ncbi:hypothetical protein PMAYCL1PPCAC_27544, partial [Pristionchus mayeri]